MIKELSLKALQKAMNTALSLDPGMPSRVSALGGKVLEVVISPLEVRFFIGFGDDGRLTLSDRSTTPATAVIHSSPLGLIRLSLLPTSRARSLFNDKVRLSGDVAFGEQVKKLFDAMDIDWESHLAHFTGDVVAHQIGSLFRQGRAFKNRLEDSLRGSMTEYLQEEVRLFPGRQEIGDFLSDVDTLMLTVERLQARINHLQARHEAD
jgi:ubiquinone biosynthesis protein UbiJ